MASEKSLANLGVRTKCDVEKYLLHQLVVTRV